MPGHTLRGFEFPDRKAFMRYAEEIKSIAAFFDRVVVCVHPACRHNGLWVSEFSSLGFEIIYGAETHDANALPRMRALFEQFEAITTNGWGSQVAYALAFGAKVAIWGTMPDIGEKNYLLDTTWAANRASLKAALSAETKAREQAFLAKFLVPPQAAVADKALGEWLIGAENRISPGEMRELLGELIDPDPARTGASVRSRVLFVLPDTQRSTGNLELLNLLRWLRRERPVAFDVLIGTAGGAMQGEFGKIATLFLPGNLMPTPERLREYRLACVVHCAASTLAAAGFAELPPLWILATEGLASLERVAARDWAWLQRYAVRYWSRHEVVAEALGKRYGVPAEQIASFPVGVDKRRLELCATAEDVAQLRASLEIPGTSFVVVTSGLLDYRHGADLFPLLVRSLRARLGPDRNVVCFWTGAAGSSEFDRGLAQDVKILGLGHHCRFLGEFAQETILLALADLVCVPGREVALTPALREAQALGKPLVAFAQSGPVADFCTAGAGEVVPYLDIEAMAGCLAGRLLRGDAREAKGPEAVELPAQAGRLVHELKQLRPLAPDRKGRRALREVYESWRQAENTPQGAYARAYLQRQKERAQAGQLVAAGRKPEATKMLIGAAQGALALNEPHGIVEALLEIAHDLGRLDARQGEAVLGEAQKFSRARGLNLEAIRKTLDI
ncbi:MAG: glycosyltransferase [Verrucomicrobia bacterium]|nr:glycosyltransferase [Verrucomicrobiota bacterium]